MALKAFGAWLAWTGAHAIAGLLFFAFVAVLPPFGSGSNLGMLPLDGLAAGILFGLGQWLVLRWFLPAVRWWLPATVVASPISWTAGIMFGTATLSLGGWIGGSISAGVQTAVLGTAFQRRRFIGGLGTAYLVAAVLGGAVFYFGYLIATTSYNGTNYLPPSFQPIFVGSVAYGAITGVAVALFVWFTSRTSGAPSTTGRAA